MDLHVSNLPFKLTEAELQEIFEEIGPVESVQIILNHKLRQSKGYGFVKMVNEQDGLTAIDELNGFEVQDRALKVSKSMAKTDEKTQEKKVPFWKSKKKPKQKLVTFGDEPATPQKRKKRRGQGRGTKY
ncbi:RNA recognition motif domain-containing protein [Jiulongibacter sp. NS-SX5]|uniref:RNA recognition motif domain-containing protein n=1 Tax=Jiulongibacter sp. NS-SX5 TaxID=3463854 RepID=UPI004058BF5B